MTREEEYFRTTGEQIKNSEIGSIFGKLCFKMNNKAFLCFFQNEMVFKLKGSIHQQAMSLKGSKLFDPSGKDRPMKEWVQVPFQHHETWMSFAEHSAEYVKKK